MGCKEFREISSAYIDGRLNDKDTVRYREHLGVCVGCDNRLVEMGTVSAALGQLGRPVPPRELHSYVMTAAKRVTEGRINPHQRAVEWLQRLNPYLVSYSAGAVISMLLFGMTMAGFRPLQSGISIRDAAVSPLLSAETVTGSEFEYRAYNGLPANSSVGEDSQFYVLPRLGDDSSLVTFSFVAYRNPGDEGAAAVVEVNEYGKARIVEVLTAPTDPNLLGLLQWSLSRRPFLPAKELSSGQPVTTRIILLVHKMDIIG